MDGNRTSMINAWCLYDWANSAFATTVMAAVFPPFYRSLVLAAGFSEATATAFWGYTASLAMLIAAVLGPFLGAIADSAARRKVFLGFFAGCGIVFTALFLLIGEDTWALASLLYTGANIGFSGGNVFYDSLLPSVAKGDDIDRVSTRGYAFGYMGGGVLLALNAVWLVKPEWFSLSGQAAAAKLCFVSVAAWWFAFSIPIFRRVPEPRVTSSPLPPTEENGIPREPLLPRGIAAGILVGFRRLGMTFIHLRRYRHLAVFLIAFWFYNDGIGSIIKLATAYGDEIGIGLSDMILALILTQFVGIPFAFWFGRLARRFGARPMISAGLVVYVIICAFGYLMEQTWHFYALAFAVGTVQGGTQALSRSLFGSMVPEPKAAEFFGFFSVSEKFAGIFGPLLFGVVAQLTGRSRFSILSLIAFFILGLILLWKVDIGEGRRMAKETTPGSAGTPAPRRIGRIRSRQGRND